MLPAVIVIVVVGRRRRGLGDKDRHKAYDDSSRDNDNSSGRWSSGIDAGCLTPATSTATKNIPRTGIDDAEEGQEERQQQQRR